MRNVRLIPRLDVKQNWLIKGIQMEGWRKIGDPADFAQQYAAEGADELVFMDVVASLYNRNNLHDVVEKVASSVFIPLTVGGGVRSKEDVRSLLARGADKVSINTAATTNPSLITEVSDEFGAQATIITIEAIHKGNNKWEAMTDNGRNQTGRDAVDWAAEVEQRGAGEIFVTSIDRDGTKRGYDVELMQQISERVSVPVVASGGLGEPSHLRSIIDNTEVSAASLAASLYWKTTSIEALQSTLADAGCYVRSR